MSGGGAGSGGYDPKKLGQSFGNKLTEELNKPPQVFNKPLYAGVGSETQGGIKRLGQLGRSADFAGGMQAPGYKAVRNNLRDTVATDVGSMFNASGRFGGGSHVNNLTDQLTDSLGAFDYQNYNNQLDRQRQGVEMQLGAGQMLDADKQAALLADNDLFRRTHDTERQNLLELLGGFTGSQGAAGMTEEQPWWMKAIGLAGQFV